MTRCIFCHEDKSKLTDEHIIPAALSSNIVLKKSSCAECQAQCNSSFETRFLKGSNFIALLRAQLGLKGRRNEPIYGFDRHGSILTCAVQPGFPEIRIGISAGGIRRPPQIICLDESSKPLGFFFFPDSPPKIVTVAFISELVGDIPEGTKTAALWMDGDMCTANGWRMILEAFVAWGNQKQIVPIASSVATENATVNFQLDWTAEYRDRGIAKICFVFLMSLLDESSRHGTQFADISSYILKGKEDATEHRVQVIQWNGEHPLQFATDLNFHVLLAVVEDDAHIYGLIQLFNMGLFAVRLGQKTDDLNLPDTLKTYFLDKSSGEAGTWHVTEHGFEITERFAKAARYSGQLT